MSSHLCSVRSSFVCRADGDYCYGYQVDSHRTHIVLISLKFLIIWEKSSKDYLI